MFRTDRCPDDRVIFVDGSRFYLEGEYVTGFAVLDETTGTQSLVRLPGHMSAQRAELEAVKEALLLQPPGKRTIYSDSSYVVRSLTLHLDIWKKRGFVDSQNKPLAHVSVLKELWEWGMAHMTEAAIIKIPAHQKGDEPLIMGNNKADELAKLAAVSGTLREPGMGPLPTHRIAARTHLSDGPVSFEEEQS
ncbi:ribonuclease H-like [Bufo bufo]|uniref:ribonuclease H-like n=1 Tax=Bufo bufo TaxID=8384 RepID=UPI001ABDE809|nr:ribonuclease H-like [Bufo bufo]